ncbi:uncharacterized protein LOC141911582 [Tubulanus polymorphus]|uniref:uncharacterized protein LOC141911582 n=1 Tax=Tubulanus polymorphus TaxID=672921 RepID=UPI003DA4C660
MFELAAGGYGFVALAVIAATFTTSLSPVEGSCFGQSCDGWMCRCTDEYDAYTACPIQNQTEDGDLTCPPSTSHCMRIPYDDSRFPRWSGPGCQIGNIAAGKEASMSSLFDRYRKAYRCLDGSLRTKKCQTRYERFPWFRANLASQYVVQSVSVSYGENCSSLDRAGMPNRYLEIRVGDSLNIEDNPLCKNISTSKLSLLCSSSLPFFRITCRTPLVGKYVTLQYKSLRRTTMAFYEIEVTGFRYIDPADCSVPNTYGCMTSDQCDTSVADNRVDYLSGACSKGCSPNLIGNNCQSKFRLSPAPEELKTYNDRIVVGLMDLSAQKFVDSGRGPVYPEYQIIYRSISDNDSDWTIAGQTNETRFEIGQLRPFTSYAIATRLRKWNSTSKYLSNSLQVKTSCLEPTNAPSITNLYLTSRLSVTWQPIDISELRCSESTAVYYVYYKTTTMDRWRHIELERVESSPDAASPEQTSIIDDYALMGNGNELEIKIGVKNPDTEVVFGPVVNMKTDSPATYVNDTASRGGIILEWNNTRASELAESGARIEYYVLYHKVKHMQCKGRHWKNTLQRTPFAIRKPHLQLVDLYGNTRYVFRIEARVTEPNNSTVKIWNKFAVNTVTGESTPIGSPPPADVQLEALPDDVIKETTYVTVRFHDIAACADRNGELSAYWYRMEDVTYGYDLRMSTAYSSEVKIDNLPPNTRYELKYKWVNKAGESEMSEPKYFTTAETSLPYVNLSVKQLGSGQYEAFFRSRFGTISKRALECGATTGGTDVPDELTIRFWDIKEDKFVIDISDDASSTHYGCRAAVLGKKGWSEPSEWVYLMI